MEFRESKGVGNSFADACAIRKAVFCDEQGFSPEGEFDATDAEAWHVTGYLTDRPLCTGRLFWGGEGVLHLGRIAVLANGRGSGTGAKLVQAMLALARRLEAKRVVLDAQADKTGFYEKQGFAATGVRSLDEGVPHAEMEMWL